jgi:hypothetical protein
MVPVQADTRASQNNKTDQQSGNQTGVSQVTVQAIGLGDQFIIDNVNHGAGSKGQGGTDEGR